MDSALWSAQLTNQQATMNFRTIAFILVTLLWTARGARADNHLDMMQAGGYAVADAHQAIKAAAKTSGLTLEQSETEGDFQAFAIFDGRGRTLGQIAYSGFGRVFLTGPRKNQKALAPLLKAAGLRESYWTVLAPAGKPVWSTTALIKTLHSQSLKPEGQDQKMKQRFKPNRKRLRKKRRLSQRSVRQTQRAKQRRKVRRRRRAKR
jgi:hypothetical protein